MASKILIKFEWYYCYSLTMVHSCSYRKYGITVVVRIPTQLSLVGFTSIKGDTADNEFHSVFIFCEIRLAIVPSNVARWFPSTVTYICIIYQCQCQVVIKEYWISVRLRRPVTVPFFVYTEIISLKNIFFRKKSFLRIRWI